MINNQINNIEQDLQRFNTVQEIQVRIEISANTLPIKYEIDKKTELLWVDRFIPTAMFYPCNYGFLPNSLGLDNDPLDILVITPYPVVSGAMIQCRAIGVLDMVDEAGEDHKIIAVPVNKLTQLYAKVNNPEDLPVTLLESIRHFFEHYKDLETGKWVKVKTWQSADRAAGIIIESFQRAIQNRSD